MLAHIHCACSRSFRKSAASARNTAAVTPFRLVVTCATCSTRSPVGTSPSCIARAHAYICRGWLRVRIHIAVQARAGAGLILVGALFTGLSLIAFLRVSSIAQTCRRVATAFLGQRKDPALIALGATDSASQLIVRSGSAVGTRRTATCVLVLASRTLLTAC